MNLKEQILSAKSELKTVVVPQWATTVFLRPMASADVVSLIKQNLQEMDNATYQASVLVRQLSNEDGSRIFGDDETHLLQQKEQAVIEQLFSIALAHTEAVKEQLKKKLAANTRIRFIFELALSLNKTVKQLLNELDDSELLYWEALNELNPIGRWKEEFHQARLCSTIVSTAGVTSKPADYMWREEEAALPDSQTLVNKLTRWASASGKTSKE